MRIFHHKSIKRRLKTPISRVKDERINNSMIRDRFLNEEPIKETWRRRQLLCFSRTLRNKCSAHPKILLTVTLVGKRVRGRPHRTSRDVMVDNANNIIHNVGEDGRVDK